MATWTLVPCLTTLRGEFNLAGPNRDRASDGSIGDQAHSQSSSDHNPDETGVTPYEDGDDRNEVHAIDIDKSGPWVPGFNFDARVEHVRREHELGRDNRLQNIIYKGRIASRSWGWTWRKYTGSNPHNEHAHFSARYVTAAENDTSSWGVAPEGDDMATISQADFNARMDAWWNDRMAADASPSEALTNLRRAPWNQPVGAAGDTMYQIIHRAAQAATVLPIAQATADALRAFVAAEGIEDAELEASVSRLQAAVDEANVALAELTADPPPSQG